MICWRGNVSLNVLSTCYQFTSNSVFPGVTFFCSEQYLIVFLCFPLQYPTLVRMCAATSVSSDLVDTPAPARKDPLRWSLTPINVTQVNSRLSASAACTLVLSAASHFAFINPFFTRAWLLLCGFVKCVCCCCWFCVCLASAPAAIEAAVSMPLACRCMNGGTCYTDEGGLPKCKWVQL